MKNLILLAGIVMILAACNPQNIRRQRAEGTSSKADSSLYYPSHKLSNPFLDSLKSGNDKDVKLSVKLVPPPAPPAPKFKQIDGYRVQAFAGVDSLSALTLKSQLEKSQPDTVYLMKENNLFKIQIGDFPYRNPADMLVLDLRKSGINGAWVVQRKINVPNVSAAQSGDTLNMPPGDSIKANTTQPAVTIQVLATSDELRAKEMISELGIQFGEEAFYKKSGGIYKVFLGRFTNRSDAESVLSKVKAGGYKDAWLVY